MEHERLFELLLKVANNDKSAFEKLYMATKNQMYAIALNILKRPELAEEACQEGYVKIWYNASSYQEGQGTVLTWMISIVRYRALDMLRYKNVRKEEPLEEDNVLTVDLDFVQSVSGNDKLKSCMSELELAQRQAIQLAFVQGLSHAEVVQSIDSPLGSVKSWIRRGLKSLKRCLTS